MSRITGDQTRSSDAPSKRASSKRASKATSRLKHGSLEHIIAVLDVLNDLYSYDEADPQSFATGEPLDGLILTLLSQNTNDRNRDMAYERLRAHAPAWEDVAVLSADEIASLIKSAGLGDTKAVRMKRILARIHDDFGAYSLKKFFGEQPQTVREYLSSLEGIGPKTVACVMVFDLGMAAFPVDTHVARLSRRFGFCAEKDTPEKIQNFLESVVPAERCRGGHLNMITHGRRVCGARRPMCGECAASHLCPSSGRA